MLPLAPARPERAVPAVQVFRDRADGALSWRMISANGRELARSATSFSDRDAVARDVRDLAGVLDDSHVRVMPAGGRAWRWVVVRDSVTVARSTATFDRRMRCSQAGSTFVRTLATSTVKAGVVDGSHRTSGVSGAVVDLHAHLAPRPVLS